MSGARSAPVTGRAARGLLVAASCCVWLLTVVVLVSGQDAYMTEVRRLAAEGDAVAQFELGVLYAFGRGVPQDYEEAARWYRLAADQGHASAQYNLGVSYAFGRGVPQDHGEAVRWYRLAADQGLANAQFRLGRAYHDGRGVPQDYEEAVRWYRLAADWGHPGAQNNLGVMYANGPGRAAGLRHCSHVGESRRGAGQRERAPSARSSRRTDERRADRRRPESCTRVASCSPVDNRPRGHSSRPMPDDFREELREGVTDPKRQRPGFWRVPRMLAGAGR